MTFREWPTTLTLASDSSWCPTTLCNATIANASEEAAKRGHTRAVSTDTASSVIALMVLLQRHRRALTRSQILRATAAKSPIPPTFYKSISQELSKGLGDGSFLKDGPAKKDEAATPPNPLTDPNAMDGMMSGMKTQMVMMVPQMVIMGWINFFFQGFVLSEYRHLCVSGIT